MYKRIIRKFSYSSPYLKELHRFSGKLNLKQTIKDKRDLQRFLENQVKDGKIKSTIQRTSRYDKEFSDFLKEYQAKNRDSPNIIDISHYTRNHESFNKDFEQRKEEIIMLDEFRKRRQEELRSGRSKERPNPRLPFEQSDDEGDLGEEFKDNEEENIEDEEDIMDKKFRKDDDFSIIKKLNNYKFNKDEFITLVLSQDTTTLVTKLNRINHFRTLLFAGNFNGVIGYGKGKGNDFEEAFTNAETNLKKNLIAIPLDHFCPLTNEVRTKFYGFELRLFPKTFGMNSWGSPTIAHMLLYTGITNVKFKCIFRNMNPYAMVMTYFKALTSLSTPKDISETLGVKIYRQNYGKPVPMNKNFNLDSFL